MVGKSIHSEIVEMLEDNGNRMIIDEAAKELNERVDSITFDEYVAEERIREAIEDDKRLVKDRYGGKDRIEKVVY